MTDKELKSLKPTDKIYRKSCSYCGLMVRVMPSGNKYFEFENKANKIRLAIGEYGDISLNRAKEIAFDMLSRLKSGESLKNSGVTFGALADRLLEIKSATLAPSSIKRDRILLQKPKKLLNMDISKITTLDIIETIKEFENGSDTPKRLFNLISQVYKSASHITRNITADINYKYTFKTVKPNNYPTLTNPSDIKALLISIDEYNGYAPTRYALKLAIFTAVRPFNVRCAEWAEIDLDKGVWSILANKMKMGREFTLPLNTQAVQLLKEWRLISGSDSYCFKSAKEIGRPLSENTLNSALRRMGYTRDELVSHGFRAMFSTLAHENLETHKQSSEIIERCLAHQDKNSVRATYNRSKQIEYMRKVMQWWGDYLDGLLLDKNN
jgi:integrase